MEKIVTSNVKQTQEAGNKLAKKLKEGDVLCLYGNLGSGKTSFVQGLAQGLGIKKRIISPTFIIVRSYELKIGNFYHIDLYRTESKRDLVGLGLDELIKSGESIVAIEWAEKLGDLLPDKRTDLFFEQVSLNERKITLKRYG